MRRTLFVSTAALCGVLLVAGPAWAHSEFDPGEAGTGNVVTLQLSVENEQADAGTTQVQLFFPEGVPITLVDLPAVAGWTTTVDGGAIGSPVTSVTWSRPTASPDENPLLPLTIGPMPADPVRLQFKALQTYANGDIDRWIEDWPAGAPEPEHPAPVLEVVTGGPGTAPETTVAGTSPTSAETTTTPTTEATTESTLAATSPDDGSDDSSNVGAIVGIIAAVVVVAAVGGFLIWRRSQRPATDPSGDTAAGPGPEGDSDSDDTPGAPQT